MGGVVEEGEGHGEDRGGGCGGGVEEDYWGNVGNEEIVEDKEEEKNIHRSTRRSYVYESHRDR